VRVGSPFSLTEIKRKLKHAIGKEKLGNHKNNDLRGKIICKDKT
jgi:hypothetical protein